MSIDFHCHAGRGDGLSGPWDTDAPLGPYLARARAAGITHSVLFPAFSSDYGAANRALAGVVNQDPRRFSGFAFVHPARDHGHVARIVREAVEEFGFKGIKVHRHDARLSREVCETAQAWNLPVLYDVTGDVASLDLIAQQYPGVRFVIPHLGSFADDWRAQTAFIDQLVRHPNVSTDTSGVRRFDLLARAVRRAGPGKVVFGSDGPWLHPGVELAKVHALGLPPGQERLITSANALALLAPAGTRRNPPPGPRPDPGRPPAVTRGTRGTPPRGRDPWTAPPGDDPENEAVE